MWSSAAECEGILALSLTSVIATTVAKGCSKTMPGPCAGAESWPRSNKDMPTLSVTASEARKRQRRAARPRRGRTLVSHCRCARECHHPIQPLCQVRERRRCGTG